MPRNHTLSDQPSGGQTPGAQTSEDARLPLDPNEVIDAFEKRTADLMRHINYAAGIGLAIGILLISLSHSGWLNTFAEEVVKDLGIGFVVGAAVGMLYEARARAGPQAKADMRLETRLTLLAHAEQRFREAEERLLKPSDPESGIRKRLEILLPGEGYSDFNEHILRLIREMVAIGNSNAETKMTDEYVAFVNWILATFAVNGVKETANLLRGFSNPDAGEAKYSLPERRTLTLQLMSAQMRSMRANDKYDSVTSTWLYNNAPDEYTSATLLALQNGLHIRRIFNLCASQNSERCNLAEERLIIDRQIARLNVTPNFEWRYLTSDTLDKLSRDVVASAGLRDINDVKTLYFGHFHHVDHKKISRFEVRPPDMSKIHVSVFSLNRGNDEPGCFLNLFEDLWEHSATKPPWAGVQSAAIPTAAVGTDNESV